MEKTRKLLGSYDSLNANTRNEVRALDSHRERSRCTLKLYHRLENAIVLLDFVLFSKLDVPSGIIVLLSHRALAQEAAKAPYFSVEYAQIANEFSSKSIK